MSLCRCGPGNETNFASVMFVCLFRSDPNVLGEKEGGWLRGWGMGAAVSVYMQIKFLMNPGIF